ncbi:OmpA family protein [Psychrobacter sp. KCTC 72983]|uniref:OmpA family protein n=1 Tax=Psychrobacter sp. KCTC 72983 TaxID=2733866 RepID=UPI001647A438|nr:OmpA family protein [Psychrobacter sp. KCTC 72983]
MNSKVLLSTALAVAMSLTGCQTMTSNLASANDSPMNKAMWQKSGEVFQQPNDMMLKANESRIVFLRQDDSNVQAGPIVVGVGADNLFQVSLDNNHYSEVVICNDSQIVTAQNMNAMNGQVMAQSKQFSFMPQTTTYLQVSLSATGTPVVQQVSPNRAMSTLNQSTRQTHQISRVFIECSVPKPVVIPPTVIIPVQPPTQNLPIRNERQFTVLFDFDSTNITSETASELGLMADFIKTRRTTNNIVLEGHTDSKGSDVYNNKLSKARADTAKNILVNKYGVDSMKLTPMGYGESLPVDTNNTDQGRQNNRRVVATVVSEQ